MRRRGALGLALAAALLAAGTASAAPAKGFSIRSGVIVDAKGTPFVMRGVNLALTVGDSRVRDALPDIAATGANAVRLFVSQSAPTAAPGETAVATTPDAVKGVVGQCRALKLVCLLVNADTSGYGEAGSPTAVSMTQAAAFWKTLLPALKGQEAYTLLDLGQMPYGATLALEWQNDATAAIKVLRQAGFRHTLLVGAPDYGQDDEGLMTKRAPEVFASDPLRNTAFSIAMYATFWNPSVVKAYGDVYTKNKLALVVGEFSWAYLPYGAFNVSTHYSSNPAGNALNTNNGADGPDEAAIMAYAQAAGIGWFAYSWSGSSPEKAYDDMVVGFQPAATTNWFNTVVYGAGGMQQTSRPASVFTKGAAR